MEDNWYEGHKKLTEDQKKILFRELKSFDKYGDIVYREEDLNEIGKRFEALVEYAERYLNENASNKFDQVTINRNIKELKKKVGKFRKEAEKVQKRQNRLTALYDDIGMKFNRYFEVGDDTNEKSLTEGKLRGIIKEEVQKLTEMDARMFRRVRQDLRTLDIGGGVKSWTNEAGKNRIKVELMNGDVVFLRQVLTDKVKIMTNKGSKVVRDSGKNVAREIQKIVT